MRQIHQKDMQQARHIDIRQIHQIGFIQQIRQKQHLRQTNT